MPAGKYYLRVPSYLNMSLIKSISGIRGTIGGAPGAGLTPIDIVRFTTAYGAWLMQRARNPRQTDFRFEKPVKGFAEFFLGHELDLNPAQ